MGDLKEIIIGLKNSLDSTCLVPRFGIKRVYCGRKCMKGDSCKMCNHTIDLATVLGQTPIRVMKEDFEDGKGSDSESGNTEENIE